MSFELQILLQRLLMPFLMSSVGCYLLATTDQGEEGYDDEPARGVLFATLFGAVLCGVAMIAADLWSRGQIAKPMEWSQWRAKYQWEWMVWMIPASMLGIAILRCWFSTPIHYVGMAIAATVSIGIGLLYVCLNEGSVWQDQSDKLLPWVTLGLAAILWNTLSLNSIARSGGSRWNPLITLAQLGCVGYLAFQAYASLGEWVLTGIGVALGASLIAGIQGSSSTLHFGWQLSTVVVPLGIMAVCCLAVSRFVEQPVTPDWLIGCILFLPSVVGVVDLASRKICSSWVRAIVAALVCTSALAILVYYVPPVTSSW
ncbi:MAG: hypothetical protein ACOVLE_07330 [Pirellula staleyi]